MSYMNNEQKMIDIIFAGRNQEYGAYTIRSSYGNTVFKSLSFMIIGVGSVLSLAFYLNHRNPDPENKGDVPIAEWDTTTVYFPPEDPLPPAPDPPASSASSEASGRIVITDSALVAADTSLVETPVVGNGTVTNGPPVTGTTGIISGKVTIETPDTSARELISVESMPEFEGGLKALSEFIRANLKYPGEAYEAGKDGTLHVRFVVDEKGKVGRLTLRNKLGFGLDEEALRVVGLLPDFKKPGMAGGKPVKTYYQIPIRFRFK